MLLGVDVYNNIIEMYCIHGPSIRAGQYYRLLTGIFFLDGGVVFFFVKMVIFFDFGWFWILILLIYELMIN